MSKDPNNVVLVFVLQRPLDVKNFTYVILLNKAVGEFWLQSEAILGVLLTLSVLCTGNRRVEVVDSKYARLLIIS